MAMLLLGATNDTSSLNVPGDSMSPDALSGSTFPGARLNINIDLHIIESL